MASSPTHRREGPASTSLAPLSVSRALAEMTAEGPVTIRVRGDCMAPGLRDGDRVEVVRRRWYWPGDVVAFQDRRGRLTVHRVIGGRPARGGWRLLTQADAAPRADSSLPRERIVGRVQTPVSWKARLWAVGRFLRLVGTLPVPRNPSR